MRLLCFNSFNSSRHHSLPTGTEKDSPPAGLCSCRTSRKIDFPFSALLGFFFQLNPLGVKLIRWCVHCPCPIRTKRRSFTVITQSCFELHIFFKNIYISGSIRACALFPIIRREIPVDFSPGRFSDLHTSEPSECN